jgi:hypothetical protein
VKSKGVRCGSGAASLTCGPIPVASTLVMVTIAWPHVA